MKTYATYIAVLREQDALIQRAIKAHAVRAVTGSSAAGSAGALAAEDDGTGAAVGTEGGSEAEPLDSAHLRALMEAAADGSSAHAAQVGTPTGCCCCRESTALLCFAELMPNSCCSLVLFLGLAFTRVAPTCGAQLLIATSPRIAFCSCAGEACPSSMAGGLPEPAG